VRISERRIRAQPDGSGRWARTDAPSQDGSKIGFKGYQAGVEQLALRDDHEIVAGRDLVATKNLSNQSFSAVSLDRAAQLLACRHPKPPFDPLFRQQKERRVAAVNARAAVVHELEIGTAPDPLVGPKILQLFAADRKPLAPFGTTPLQDEASIFRAHPYQKSVRPLAMTRVRLKRAFALHECPSRRNPELSILVNRFPACQLRRAAPCVTVARLFLQVP